MRQYEKPTVQYYAIITGEIALGLVDFLNKNEIYTPGITTFEYNS